MPIADCQMPNGNTRISRRGAEPQSSSLRASAPLRETRLFPSRNSQLATRNSECGLWPKFRGLPSAAFRAAHAFTMIELLVVIGIILILMGLFFAGAKVVTAQAKARDTKTMLQIAATMFANYEQAGGLNTNVPYNLSQGGNGPIHTLAIKGANPANLIQLYQTIGQSTQSYAQAASLVWSEGEVPAPQGAISPDAIGLSNPNHGALHLTIANTEAIMQAMLTVPENQTIVNNLPSSKIAKDAANGIPLLLDGYGNPILFVPGGGLAVVWVDPSFNQAEVITTEGVKNPSGPSAYNPSSSTVPLPNKPFFVSAGPDGDMSNAHGYTSGNPTTSDMTDDNIYSFQP
jgi:prepilin-type N-terminal cleavage/methylation domain-containing protein